MLHLKTFLDRFKLKSGSSYYLLTTFAEMFLIVLGILLALQLDNLDKEQDKRKLEVQYYHDLTIQLDEDKQVLLEQIQYSNNFRKQFEQIINIVTTDDHGRQRELAEYTVNLKNNSDFRRKSTIFQTLISSGDIKHITDKKIVAGLQNLEGDYSYIDRVEDTHLEVILENVVPSYVVKAVRIFDLSLADADTLYNYQFENIVLMVIGLMDEKTDIYQRSIKQIELTSSLIEVKLNKMQA